MIIIIHATSSSSVSYMPITFGDITFRGLFPFVFFGVTFICKRGDFGIFSGVTEVGRLRWSAMLVYQNKLSIIIAHERIFTYGFISFCFKEFEYCAREILYFCRFFAKEFLSSLDSGMAIFLNS